MEHTGPLEPFFEWLSREQSLEITLGDRLRMGRLFQAEGEWTLQRLEDGLGALLTHDPEQSAQFRRHFRQFFAAEAARNVRPRPLDRQALVAALQRLNEEPPPVPARAVTLDAPSARIEIVSPEVKLTAAPRVLFRLREVPWPAPLSTRKGERPVRAARLRVVWAKDDPGKPRQFFWARVGDPPAPLLDDRLLDHLADAMGYFQSQRPSRLLDVDRTLRASLEQCYPVLQFVPGREVCQLLVLEDTTADARARNTVPRELAAGLADRGVPVTYGLRFGKGQRFVSRAPKLVPFPVPNFRLRRPRVGGSSDWGLPPRRESSHGWQSGPRDDEDAPEQKLRCPGTRRLRCLPSLAYHIQSAEAIRFDRSDTPTGERRSWTNESTGGVFSVVPQPAQQG